MKTQRTFIIGDEWLYYKIYCGTKTADYILSEVILPTISELKENQLINNWFFIRYQDPKQHLRLRFRCSDSKNIGQVINLLNEPLKELVDQDLIWKIQLDTYQRELERYGSNSIVSAEKLFCFDSELVAGFINLTEEGSEADELRWMFALQNIDRFLADFNYSTEQRKELLFWLKSDFAKEFHMEKNLKKQVNDRYRKYRGKIEEFMKLTPGNAGDYLPLLELLETRSLKNKNAIAHILELEKLGKLEMNLNELLASFIHMIMNRLFKSKNRLHEMIGYDFLYRYYMAKISKNKQEKRPKALIA